MRKIKKNKSSNYMLIGIIYVIIILTISTAYSFLNENLSITTTASIPQSGDDYIIDNILIKKEVIDDITYYSYDVVLTYTKEKTTTGWETYIKIPFDSEVIECYNASSCTVEGETLTIKNNTSNAILSPTNTSTTFSYRFKTSNSTYDFTTLGVKFLTDGEFIEQDTYDNSNNPDIPSIKNINSGIQIYYDWGVTKQYLFAINNNSDYIISSWTTKIYVPNDFTINALWSATWNYDETTSILTMSGPSWNPKILANTKFEVNMNVSTPIEEEIYIIETIVTTEDGEQYKIDTTGNVVE